MKKQLSSSQSTKGKKYPWFTLFLLFIVGLLWFQLQFVTSLQRLLVDDEFKSVTITSSIDSKRQYEGVVAMLMLNSPKWYQLRYTSTIANAFINIPPTWAVQIFYTGTDLSQAGLDHNPGIGRLQQTYPDRLVITKLPSELIQKYGMRKRLLYWTDAWMWEQMLSDRVFVINGGGIICANSQISLLDGTAASLFDQLDYIGSPWGKFQKRGGDGTISFRNRKAMLDVIRYKSHDGKMTEDYYFVSNLLQMNKEIYGGEDHYRVANEHQMQIFGGIPNNFTESMGPPMIISGTLSKLDHSIRDTVLNLCPELKLIFPVLHNPNCFGAHPNSGLCAESICALQDPEQRKSGC